jgi:hypothetical protein
MRSTWSESLILPRSRCNGSSHRSALCSPSRLTASAAISTSSFSIALSLRSAPTNPARSSADGFNPISALLRGIRLRPLSGTSCRDGACAFGSPSSIASATNASRNMFGAAGCSSRASAARSFAIDSPAGQARSVVSESCASVGSFDLRLRHCGLSRLIHLDRYYTVPAPNENSASNYS